MKYVLLFIYIFSSTFIQRVTSALLCPWRMLFYWPEIDQWRISSAHVRRQTISFLGPALFAPNRRIYISCRGFRLRSRVAWRPLWCQHLVALHVLRLLRIFPKSITVWVNCQVFIRTLVACLKMTQETGYVSVGRQLTTTLAERYRQTSYLTSQSYRPVCWVGRLLSLENVCHPYYSSEGRRHDTTRCLL